MKIYVAENGSWGNITGGLNNFTIVNTEDWGKKEFDLLDGATDSDKVRTANEIRERLDAQNDTPRTVWDSLDGKLEELFELATELDSIELHALAVDIQDVLGK